jgi:predicted O-linked N-acetylglucosamine transferase (SPINDLY family)
MPQVTAQQIFEQAVAMHQAGRLAEAESLYRQVLAAQANRADVLQRLGILSHQLGRRDQAIELLQKAAELNPNAADCHANLGAVLAAQGRFEDAIVALGRAIELRPDLAQAHNNLGNALRQLGRMDEASVAFGQACSAQPAFAEAWFNLGSALQATGKLDQAVAAFQRAIALRPNWPEAHNNLGSIFHQRGGLDDAIGCYRQAAALAPLLAEVHNNLSAALLERGKLQEAVDEARRAVALRPDDPQSHFNLGNALRQSGDSRAAIASYDQAITLRPDFADAHANRGSALKDTGNLDGAIEAYRRAISISPNYGEVCANLANALRERGDLDESIELYRKAGDLTGIPWIGGNLLYTLHFHPDYDARRIYQEHVRWNHRYVRPLKITLRPHENDRLPDRKLRVGYVSCDLRHHAVGRFMLPLLANHDHERFAIHCYSDTLRPDAITDELRGHSQGWRDTLGLADERFCELVRSDRIDILVDLSMHARTGRMMAFARKPAPVQVSYLAYCSTSGLESMDYRLSDPYLDSPDSDEGVYFERTIRLKGYWCYDRPRVAPQVSPLPAASNGSVTFGCLNTYAKVTRNALRAWARILRAVPNSRLILHSLEGGHRQSVRDLFAAEGVDPARIEFVAYMTGADYFARYNEIDIALDPFPYAGGTTTCDALWMGVPVVSLTGNTAVSRGGLSILSSVGMREFVTDDLNRYEQIAIELAGDRSRLAHIRSSLRTRMLKSPLMDGASFARDVEAAYRTMWHTWCDMK